MKSRQSPLIVFAFMGIVSFDMSDVMSREEKKKQNTIGSRYVPPGHNFSTHDSYLESLSMALSISVKPEIK